MSWVPLIQKDMTVIARNKRYFSARAVLAAVLLVITGPVFLYIGYKTATSGVVPPGVARTTFVWFAWAQLGLVCLIAPVFGVNATRDARNDGALDLLRLAEISRNVFIVTKLLGAWAWPLLAIAMQVPFLALWSLWGGVSGEEMVAVVLLTSATAATLIAVGIVMGTVFRASETAYSTAYMVAAAFTILPPIAIPGPFFPTRVLFDLLGPRANLGQWGLALLFCAAVILVCALGSGLALAARDVARRRGRRTRRERSRDVWEKFPVAWRELRAPARNRWMIVMSWLASFVAAAVTLTASAKTTVIAAEAFAFWILPPILFGTLGAAAIAPELRTRTVLPLLMAPGGPRQVVFGKLLGALARGFPVLLAPLVVVIADVTADGIIKWFGAVALALLVGTNSIAMSVFAKRTPVALLAGAGASVWQATYILPFGGLVTMAIGFGGLPEASAAVFGYGVVFAITVFGNVAIASTFFEPSKLKLDPVK